MLKGKNLVYILYTTDLWYWFLIRDRPLHCLNFRPGHKLQNFVYFQVIEGGLHKGMPEYFLPYTIEGRALAEIVTGCIVVLLAPGARGGRGLLVKGVRA